MNLEFDLLGDDNEEPVQVDLVDPRTVFVPLKDHGKRNGHYCVDTSLRAFLQVRGWRVAGSGYAHLYVDPPAGVKKPFRLAAEIPSRDQLERVATEVHAARKQWSGSLGEWRALYLPPERREWGETSAVFMIGEKSLWEAQVSWMPDPVYRESASSPRS